jgi:branched-chain amino acid transport system ATP-binding protein
MLKLNNIEVAYLNVIRVLHGVSLDVADGSIVALLGANGAGKSTTLKAISGLLHVEEGEVTDGSILWNAERIDKKSAEEIGKLGIIQALEGRRVFGHLSAEENLLVGAYNRQNRRDVKQDLDMVYHYFTRLKELRHNTAGYLSGGEQQMLVIGRAMMAAPKLMMLDEPSLGLAPLLVE